MTNLLFRPEARPRASTGLGLPLGVTSGWTKVYATVLAAAIIAGGFGIGLGSYSRKVLVSGFLVPDKGLIKIEPPHSGRITEQLVAEGQHVEKDQPLFILDVSNVIALGNMGDLLERNLRNQHQILESEAKHLRVSQAADADHLNANIGALKQQIMDIGSELHSRREFLRLAQSALERAKALETKGVASLAVRDQAEQSAVNAGTQIATLQTQLGTIEGQLAQAEADWRGLTDKQANERLELDRQRTQIEQQLLQIEEQRSLVIRASQTGTVTQMTARIGTNVDTVSAPITPLLTIVPDGTTLQAYLYVPSSAIGFARIGGSVLLRYEAFPYEKFGLQDASVTTISRTSVNAHELPFPPAGEELYYLVVATLTKSTVTAFGKEEPLAPGMKFQADLILENRRLWEWAIEPILATRHSM